MALEDEAQGSCKVASSPSVCSMQTDRDDSIGCASPAISDCFNPFESSSVHSRESPRPPLGGDCRPLSRMIVHQTRHTLPQRSTMHLTNLQQPKMLSACDC